MAVEYGRFEKEGREFTIETPDIPRNWYNYFWSPQYVSFFSQVAKGEGFFQDPMGRRILFLTDRALYVKLAEKPEFWPLHALPAAQRAENYRCTHGQGWSSIAVKKRGISAVWTAFVPREGDSEIWQITLSNDTDQDCTLDLFAYVKTELDGHYRPQGYNTASAWFQKKDNAAVCRAYTRFGNGKWKPVYGYLAASLEPIGYDTTENGFMGPYGEKSRPAALLRGQCANSCCIAEKACFALQNRMVLRAGEKRTVCYLMGIVWEEEDISARKAMWNTPAMADRALRQVKRQCAQQAEGVWLRTPDKKLNMLFNYWLKRQTELGSCWARVRHNGYRDLASDCGCLSMWQPKEAWKRLKRVMAYQYSSGYAPRTWLDGSLQDKNFADCCVWLPMSACDCIMELGDKRLLEERVPFNDGTAATVYEHLYRAVTFLKDFRGLYGLIRLWGGDWNDMMNEAGLAGRGVSVWLSIAWCCAARCLQRLAALSGRDMDVREIEQWIREMAQKIEDYGWDGEYYIDAYNDRGRALGSAGENEGKIYLIPQVWSVFSGVLDPDRSRQAMDAVERYLESPLGPLICSPAYHTYDPDIGEMTQKPAGVHENGGVYLHAAVWRMAADALLKRHRAVERDLQKILPFCGTWQKKNCEPYIMCNSYFTKETGAREGTAGQSWRTASGPWLAKALVKYIFGLRACPEGLMLAPCIPFGWEQCSIHKTFRGAEYDICYKKEDTVSDGLRILVNGIPCATALLPWEKGGVYHVDVFWSDREEEGPGFFRSTADPRCMP